MTTRTTPPKRNAIGKFTPTPGTPEHQDHVEEVNELADKRELLQDKYMEQQTKIVTVDGIRVEVEMDFDPARHEWKVVSGALFLVEKV